MTALRKHKMTVDDFLAWAPTQEGRWELFDGVPVAMSPESVIHGRVKLRVANALERAIQAAAPCLARLCSTALGFGSIGTAAINRTRSSDCGAVLPDDALEVPNPVVVVEVLSPSNAMKDLRDKLQGYFCVPSIVHYLIVDPDKRIVIHHARGSGDAIATRIVSDGSFRLDPPGIELAVPDLFRPSRRPAPLNPAALDHRGRHSPR